ncbi:hypothetical protein [Streptomyces sp. NPDC059757]|uniref:hypothetical protein n=1 Tax=Streptomyces sp. NPDC059757 TaxID=3346935 RepID=UPI00366313F1
MVERADGQGEAPWSGPLSERDLRALTGVLKTASHVNDVATALACRLGHEGADIHGAVHFTGESGEADDAPGMDDETFCALGEDLAEVCNGLGVRLWRTFRPGDTVLVRPDDYAPASLVPRCRVACAVVEGRTDVRGRGSRDGPVPQQAGRVRAEGLGSVSEGT